MYGPGVDSGIAYPARWLQQNKCDHCYTHAYPYNRGRHDNTNQNAHCNEDTNSNEDSNSNENSNCDEDSDCNEHPDSNVYIYIRHDID
jgi:hypothetical protein